MFCCLPLTNAAGHRVLLDGGQAGLQQPPLTTIIHSSCRRARHMPKCTSTARRRCAVPLLATVSSASTSRSVTSIIILNPLFCRMDQTHSISLIAADAGISSTIQGGKHRHAAISMPNTLPRPLPVPGWNVREHDGEWLVRPCPRTIVLASAHNPQCTRTTSHTRRCWHWPWMRIGLLLLGSCAIFKPMSAVMHWG